ncbi:MAG: hypothetical protein KAU03_06580, partial [Candidatus Altiarchaeales archaeon]|nr:hypothetical protein [Candidatus Altiarchaeales archaeon]
PYPTKTGQGVAQETNTHPTQKKTTKNLFLKIGYQYLKNIKNFLISLNGYRTNKTISKWSGCDTQGNKKGDEHHKGG